MGSGGPKLLLITVFYGTFDLFLPKIYGKFTVKITFRVPNLSFFRGWVGSQVLYQIKPFFKASLNMQHLKSKRLFFSPKLSDAYVVRAHTITIIMFLKIIQFVVGNRPLPLTC